MIDDFLAFVVERHRIWERRQQGLPQPWTEDPILATRKFTCVFRVLDPGTQFVLTDLVTPDLSERDRLMRMFLYRHTGRIDTWQWLDIALGGYPVVEQLEQVREAWKDYRGGHKQHTYDNGSKLARTNAAQRNFKTFDRPMFTSAYLVFPQSDVKGTDKLDSIVDLAKRLFTPNSPDDIMPAWFSTKSQADRFKVLRAYKGVGDFMAMQVLADWSYFESTDLEDQFLQPGPGSVKGAKALDPTAPVGVTVSRVIKAVRELPNCPRLGYRVPSKMDIGSNLLCEWSKYDRFRRQPVPTKTYAPAHPGPQAPPVLPSYYTEGSDLL